VRHADFVLPLPELLIRRDSVIRAGGDSSAIERDARRGLLQRVAPGAYVPTPAFQALTPAQRHALRVHAVVPRLGDEVVVSHESALALHGFPLLGDWPDRVQVVDPRRDRDKVGRWAHRHAAPLIAGEVEVADGLRVAVPRRAAVDAVRRRDLAGGAVILDHGLRVGAFSRVELEAVIAQRRGVQGSRRAAAAVAFADARADSPGESLSRAVIHLAGFSRPELQVRFPAEGPLVGIVDFWWPECGVVGEFDGEVKYRDAGLRRGRTPEQIVIDEKRREDALRSMTGVNAVVRWSWADALRSAPLVDALHRAGVPCAPNTTQHPVRGATPR
jgi:hypothetical protein